MNAQVHNLTQGTPEWLHHRMHYYNASEAAAMLGISPYKSRDNLLREKATGISPEVDAATQRLFDEGHRLESLARPITEKIFGEDLFSPTMSKVVDGLNLSASFDGLTMMDDVIWECKTLNAKLRAALPDSIPEEYHPQLEQMMLISGAEKALFMAYDGETELHCWYESSPKLRKRIIAGWKQFAEDLKNWKPVKVVEDAVPETIESLPALNVQIEGGVTRSNLDTYKATALQFIAAINTDLQTDQDFADADAMVKFCGKTEKELDAVKQAALSQTADIADLFSTIDDLKAEMRTKRLALDKLVKARKQAIREEIVMAARNTFGAHLAKLDERLHSAVRMPDIDTNFGGVIKNKRTIESLHNAVNTELARVKIEANELADHINDNTKKLLELSDDKYAFLFPDIQEIVLKPADDMVNLAVRRISDHEKAEQAKLEAERERIRKEEEAKAEAKAREEAAEREREVTKNVAEAIQKAAERINAANLAEQTNEKAQHKDEPLCEDFGEPDLDNMEFCSTNEESDFDIWWRVEGSRISPDKGEDVEEFAHRIAGIAWSSGESCARRNS